MTGLVLRSEKGAPLTPDEVDGNFVYLKGLMDDFVTPTGVGIASITTAGSSMTIHLTDGSTRGPFVLPIATPSWRDEYPADQSLAVLDFFTVDGDGVYLVIVAHVAPHVFNPAYTVGGDRAYQKMFGFDITPNSALVINHYDDDFTLSSDDSGAYARMEAPGAATAFIPFDTTLPEGFTCVLRGAGVGPYTVSFVDVPTGEAGTTDAPVGVLNVPTGFIAALRDVGSTATLTHVGFNEWDIAGDLAAA